MAGQSAGYQLVGRTLPIWNTFGRVKPFTPEEPWLLHYFDQVAPELPPPRPLNISRRLSCPALKWFSCSRRLLVMQGSAALALQVFPAASLNVCSVALNSSARLTRMPSMGCGRARACLAA